MSYQELADAVKRRRDELNLNQGDLSGRGGPSITKVGQVERRQDPEPSGATLRKLDAALGWNSNTAASILRGRSVAPADDTPAYVASGSGGPRDLDDLSLEQLADEVRRVNDAWMRRLRDGA